MKKGVLQLSIPLFILILSTLLLSCGNGDETVIKNRLTTEGKSLSLINSYSPLETFKVKKRGVYRIEIDSGLSSVITITPPFDYGFVWDGNSEGFYIYENFFAYPGLATIRLRFLESKLDEIIDSTIKIKKLDIKQLELGEMGELKFDSGWNEENMARKKGYRNKFCWYLVEIKERGSYRLKLEADAEIMVSLHGADSIVSRRNQNGEIRSFAGEINRPGLYAIGATVDFDKDITGVVGLFRE